MNRPRSDLPAPAPDANSLHEAALSHLARFDASTEGLARVLSRRIDRWAVRAAASGLPDTEIETARGAGRAAIPGILERLRHAGALDDERYASRRAATDAQAGRSARASRARLSARGVDPDLARTATSREADHELESAVAHARRRRLGPFSTAPVPSDPEAERTMRRRALGSFARAGFDQPTASRVLAMTREEADDHVDRLRTRE